MTIGSLRGGSCHNRIPELKEVWKLQTMLVAGTEAWPYWPELSSHAYRLSYIFGLLSGQSAHHLSLIFDVRKILWFLLISPGKKHIPFSLPLLSIQRLYGICRNWGPPLFSCYPNVLKSLTLLCPLNSKLVTVFGPTSALSTHVETMWWLSGLA